MVIECWEREDILPTPSDGTWFLPSFLCNGYLVLLPGVKLTEIIIIIIIIIIIVVVVVVVVVVAIGLTPGGSSPTLVQS
jgi:hypothetical protein